MTRPPRLLRHTRVCVHTLVRRVRRCTLTVKAAGMAVLVSPGIAFTPVAAAAPLDPMEAVFVQHPEERTQATDCLGDAIYYEAGFEPEEGQLAVAQVILNRVKDPYYPNTVCGVVFQGWERKTGCQFSFVCDGSMKRRPPSEDQAREAREVARKALRGEQVAVVNEATHYHTDYVKPYWAPGLDKVGKVGTHIFYENPYSGPDLSRFHYEGGEIEYRATVGVKGA